MRAFAAALSALLLGIACAAASAQQDPVVRDGDGEDISMQASTSRISANWSSFSEPGDPVGEYSWTLSKKKGTALEEVLAYRSAGVEARAEAQISLEVKGQYYVQVKATLVSGKVRGPIMSNGVLVVGPAADVGEELDRFTKSPLGVSVRSAAGEAGDAVLKALEDPDKLNKVLKSVVDGDHGLKLLKDLNLEFKTLQTDGGDAVLALGYDFEKTIHEISLSSGSTLVLDLSMEASGTVALDDERNPEDFLDSSLSLNLWFSTGGTTEKATLEEGTRRMELVKKLAGIKDREQLLQSPLWRSFYKEVQDTLSTQYFVQVEAQASLESNQSLTEKQYAFEAVLGLDMKAWRNSSPETQLNVFDYPFALVRVLTGYDDVLRIRGATIPTVIVGIGRVVPQDEDARFLAGDDSDFWRVRAEASFRTPVARVSDSTVYFGANVRVYQEIEPTDPVRVADLDTYFYYSLDLVSEKGLYVSYSAGRLPFDPQDDRVYEAGLKVNF